MLVRVGAEPALNVGDGSRSLPGRRGVAVRPHPDSEWTHTAALNYKLIKLKQILILALRIPAYNSKSPWLSFELARPEHVVGRWLRVQF